ncbi:alkaline phosphatase 4 precursor [Clostridium puniceum]|uniref:Alkaline phosphatase 4 n=1 Tax=Clostridium puniceum TaxID=29367 RepID=A0A1S8TRB0_9CLOT|nr:alkaline phosphatase [Clostridium puniceum]OOM80236.1 alkaline phosphatase 4 precursor [Clostridium puniceum]
MNKTVKRILGSVLALAMVVGVGYTLNNQIKPQGVAAASTSNYNGKAPKYIFMFIGDGMSFPQIQAAQYYKGIQEHGEIDVKKGNYPNPEKLSFMNFPVTGTVTTYDSTSLCPDSASTATSLSTGNKTLSSVINMDETKTKSYETITEKLKKQLGYKVGIVSSVNIDHATPGAYYAHVPSRSEYYSMGLELVDSNFDYFAGGKFLSDDSKEVKEQGKAKIGELAKEKGYTVVNTKTDIKNLKKGDKAIAVCPDDEVEKESGAIKYNLDRTGNELTLADYTKKGIEVLDNDKGFFMMVEGGKIDWAGHANDAGANIKETEAFSDAVQEAVNFYNEHPNETLILVTGDHETGGLTIGFAGTNYDTYLQNISNQKVSYTAFDRNIEEYRKNKTSFDDAMKDVEAQFGLKRAGSSGESTKGGMVLTQAEEAKIKAAYEKSMVSKADRKLDENENVMYGTYEPFSVTLTHVLNNKSGISFSSYSHTGIPVAMMAKGLGEDLFAGYYDNTNVFDKLKNITKVQ